MDRIRWGILSTGRIAHKFARDFPYVEGGDLAAVASRSADAAEQFAREFNIPRSYATYEQLLDDGDLDAVYVATPHTLHCANTLAAIQYGKAVLCEKPLTVTPEECATIIERATSDGVYVMEALWTYFLPAVRKAREWVSEGRIGTVRHVEASFGFRVPYDPQTRLYDVELAGGALLDMGIYPLAIARYFIPEDPHRIEVIARKAPNGVDDDVAMLFDYEDAVATLTTSFRGTMPNRAFVVGDEAYVVLPEFWRARECMLYRGDEKLDHFSADRESVGLNYEVTAVNADLLAGKTESDVMPLSTSLQLQELMAAIMRHF